jgi:hypothetical protein
MSDDFKAPPRRSAHDISRFAAQIAQDKAATEKRLAAALAKDKAEGRVWQPKTPSPEETQRTIWNPVQRAVEARRAALEQAQKTAEEFERGLEEAIARMDAGAPAEMPAELAPVAPAASEPQIDPFRSGAPGRPSAIEVVLAEGRRRIEAGEDALRFGGLAEFARKLSEWWNHERMRFDPPGPPITAKTIANSLHLLRKS